MKNDRSHGADPSWIPFVSLVSFNVDQTPIIDNGSNYLEVFLFICTRICCVNSRTHFATRSLNLDDLSAER